MGSERISRDSWGSEALWLRVRRGGDWQRRKGKRKL
jgi:hypothetical protein